jgi:hypothetical protein
MRMRSEVLTATRIVFWDGTPCSLIILTDVSEELIASIIRVI